MDTSDELLYKYIFGPVRSRRLGISLGIDLVPHKTCSLDCVYCECGKTTHLTLKRKAYVPVEEIKRELTAYLTENPGVDCITFSGSGEPTLHSGIGEIISFIKERFPGYRLVLLTNGTLFHLPGVADEVKGVDVIVTSMDAALEESFGKVNKPHPELSMETMTGGLTRLREVFSGALWIEFFVIEGVNDSPEELAALKAIAEGVSADKIQVNSLDRPGTEEWVAPVSKERLAELAGFFKGAEAVGAADASHREKIVSKDFTARILSMIKRRPCTVEDISRSIGLRSNEVALHMAHLLEKGLVIRKKMTRGDFFLVNPERIVDCVK